MKRVLIGMSGGVDSTVSCCLLQEQGYEVVGVTMLLEPHASADQSIVRDAAQTCASLGVSHKVIDLRKEFEALVIKPFASAYAQGLTPNPCVRCNREVKFGLLLNIAQEMQCSHIATGHYARIKKHKGRWGICRGLDRSKDQSYFLSQVSQDALQHIIFPLGEKYKEDVRAYAQAHGLACAARPESQDVCFAQQQDYASIVGIYEPSSLQPGPIKDASGEVLGTHKGLAYYTLGQRKGLGVSVGKRVYVQAKDPTSNTLVIGYDEELTRTSLIARHIVWGARTKEDGPFEAEILTCNRGIPHSAKIRPQGDELLVEVERGMRAPTPGQYVVAYIDDMIACGGVIS